MHRLPIPIRFSGVSRMRRFLATTLLGLLVAAPVMAKPTTYTLDPNHTQVRVVWNHFGFSNPDANFTNITGTLVFDPQHPSQDHVRVKIPLSGIDTHVPALDEHLKGPDFFNVAKYPTATFDSTKVVKAGVGMLTIIGNLTVHGITHQVTLHAKVNKIGMQPMWHAQAAGFDATTTLKRSDFGVAKYAPMVSDTVKLHITVEALEAGAYAKATQHN
jgi:polyisoprenoid-binding protein YceI